MQVSAPCLPECILARVPRVALIQSALQLTSAWPRSQCLLIHADTAAPHRYVHHACVYTIYLYLILIHCACPGQPLCCALVSTLSHRVRVLCRPCSAPVPRPSPQHYPHTMYVYPCVLALSMRVMHTSCELFSPCMQESIESGHCCVLQPAWTT